MNAGAYVAAAFGAVLVALLIWYAVTAARDRRRFRRQEPMQGSDTDTTGGDWLWPARQD